MYIPGWSCIFTGRWSMLDGLQICENEPNFDSNIIHTENTGVEKGSSRTAQGWAFLSVSQVVPWLRANYISKSQECANSAAPHRTAPRPFKKKKTESCHDSEVAHRLSKNRMKTARVSRRESRRWGKSVR